MLLILLVLLYIKASPKFFFDIFGTEGIFGCKCCKNCFHKNCITTILRYNAKCPMCRTRITIQDVNRTEEIVEVEVDEDVKHITHEIERMMRE